MAHLDETKQNIGLGNVDDTSDASKPVSAPQQTSLDLKADISSLGTAASHSASDFATSVQGTKADNAVPSVRTVNGVALSSDVVISIPAAQVSSDWNATAGIKKIDNKPALGTAAAANATDFATSAQGSLASSALQAGTPASNIAQDSTHRFATDTEKTTWNAKMAVPGGSATTQYVAGDGSLKTNPSIPSAQVQSDWAQTSSGSVDYVKNKNQSWRSGVRKNTVIEYMSSAAVSGGSVTFNLTDDGTSAGNAIASTWFKESASFWVEDNTATYQFGTFTVSANKKQVTATITKLNATSTILSLISVLTGLTFVSPANGVTVYLAIKGE